MRFVPVELSGAIVNKVGAHIAPYGARVLIFFVRCGAGEGGTLGSAQTRQGSDSPAPHMDGGYKKAAPCQGEAGTEGD